MKIMALLMIALFVLLVLVTVLRVAVAWLSGHPPWTALLSIRDRRAFMRELKKREQEAYEDTRLARLQKEYFR